MADIDFSVVSKSISKYTIDDDNIIIAIDMAIKKMGIQFTLKTNYSDKTVDKQQKYLTVRNEDFDSALDALFPNETWTKPKADFKTSIVNLLKSRKNEVV